MTSKKILLLKFLIEASQQQQLFTFMFQAPSRQTASINGVMPTPVAVASSAALNASKTPSLFADAHRPKKPSMVVEKDYLRNSGQDDLKVIRLPKLKDLLGLSRSTIYNRISEKSKYYDPSFPKSVKLGSKAVGWILKDVYFYIEQLKEKSEKSFDGC